jgi:hypothetical protein
VVGKEQRASTFYLRNRKGYLMGFFAGELETVLWEHNPVPKEEILTQPSGEARGAILIETSNVVEIIPDYKHEDQEAK